MRVITAAAAIAAALLPACAQAGTVTLRAPLVPQAGETLRHAVHRLATPSLASGPVLVSGRILTPVLRVGLAPDTPRILIGFAAPAGLQSARFEFTSPDGTASFQTGYGASVPQWTSGNLIIENPGDDFGLYAAPGTWTMSYAFLCDWANVCAEYSGAQVATLFPSASFTVKNLNQADTAPPSLISARLLTPKIGLSSASPYLKILVSASDAGTGVALTSVDLLGPDNSSSSVIGVPPAPARNAEILVGQSFAQVQNVKTGIWTVSSICASDVAKNTYCTQSAAEVQALLGTTKFEITP